ncbi:alpha/beta hydrolase [Nitrososphaera sp.]|uniref:dienelactone hydrolase family protein n=1 Tax=Nitrososphaera sp. TaxID=1971748 RepID=UPI00307D2C09
MQQTVKIAAGDGVVLEGNLFLPPPRPPPRGIVVFAHGSGSSRFSPRNRQVSEVLYQAGLATLLFDLLTAEEEAVDAYTMHLRFDIGLLARRLAGVTDWLVAENNQAVKDLAIGYFGASTGAAAALVAAAERPSYVKAVVSRGGRPDLAEGALGKVKAPTLLIVGSRDEPVIEMNRDAMAKMKKAECKLVIVPGASHLFEEPGKLDEVARLARDWFLRHLVADVP